MLAFHEPKCTISLTQSHRTMPQRRQPEPKGERNMPLIRGIARTAAIAGTATAVSNRVSRRQQGRWAAQEQQQYEQQPQQMAAQAPTPAPEKDSIAKLKELGELHESGVLTDEEFAAAKAKILNA
jgi:membrane protease subunit (stomatin/prohibitin family)